MHFNRTITDNTIAYTDHSGTVFAMEETAQEQTVIIKLKGSLVTALALDFQEELIAFVTLGHSICIDFSQLDFLSNSGIQALVNAQKKIDTLKKGSLTLSNTNRIYRQLQETGAAYQLDIES